MMKGIICKEVERLEMVNNLPEPELSPGSAIVQVKRIGICGTDLHAYKGNQPFFTYPRVLGHELAGIVTRVDSTAQGVQAGDQVSIIPYIHCGSCIACRYGKTNCCTDMNVLGVHSDGGMRERISVPIENLLVTNGLSLNQTAVLEPFAIGAHAIRRSGLQAGETALVIGGGPIGLGVMALAKHAGAKVIAMDMNEDRLAFCKSWAKADSIVNANHDPVTQLMETNSREWPVVVFDATGSAASMKRSFDYAAHGGRIVFVGLVKAEISFHDPTFHAKELTLMGSRNATREDFNRVMEAMSTEALNVEQYVTHSASFDEAVGRFDSWLLPESKVIKAMVDVGQM